MWGARTVYSSVDHSCKDKGHHELDDVLHVHSLGQQLINCFGTRHRFIFSFLNTVHKYGEEGLGGSFLGTPGRAGEPGEEERGGCSGLLKDRVVLLEFSKCGEIRRELTAEGQADGHLEDGLYMVSGIELKDGRQRDVRHRHY
jgi:hypothetical protein